MANQTIETFQNRCQKVLQVAKQLHATRPDWVTFFRETLGVDGAARSVFPSQEEYLLFERSKEFEQVQNLVASLRSKKPVGKNESTKVITVRLPESLHESLKAEATEHGTSMNKLCITKLLKALSDIENAPNTTAASTPQSQPPQTFSPVNRIQTPTGQSNFRSTYQGPQDTLEGN